MGYFFMAKIYLDNAAASPVIPEVRAEIIRGLKITGNPSSFNDAGREAGKELKNARLTVARFLGAHPGEVVFTSSGSEANNLAVLGLADAQKRPFLNTIITTKIEHPSVLEPLHKLSRQGSEIIFLKNDNEGVIDLKDLEEKITSKILLVSIMYANNEVGTIQPIIKAAKIIQNFRKKHGTGFPLFHVDACQAAGYLNMKVNSLGADLLTFNGSKLNGPRGVGVLYVRQGTKVNSLVLGGGQENGFRAGTENLPAILGLAKAVSLIKKEDSLKQMVLRDYFLDKIQESMPDIKINGSSGKNRLPNNINFSIPGLDSENILLELDRHGISAGSGSACTARSVEPSHVLRALGIDKKYLSGAIRLSLGCETNKRDLEHVLKVLPGITTKLRRRFDQVEKR